MVNPIKFSAVWNAVGEYEGGDTLEVLRSAEGLLDAPSFFVETPVKAERLLSAAAVGNDWLGSAILQPKTHLGAVVGLVAGVSVPRLLAASQFDFAL